MILLLTWIVIFVVFYKNWLESLLNNRYLYHRHIALNKRHNLERMRHVCFLLLRINPKLLLNNIAAHAAIFMPKKTAAKSIKHPQARAGIYCQMIGNALNVTRVKMNLNSSNKRPNQI